MNYYFTTPRNEVNCVCQVIGTLDFTKELMGQFAKLAQDEVRDKKKMMKKEQQERAKEETNKVE